VGNVVCNCMSSSLVSFSIMVPINVGVSPHGCAEWVDRTEARPFGRGQCSRVSQSLVKWNHSDYGSQSGTNK
jgi:hypothetical protein